MTRIPYLAHLVKLALAREARANHAFLQAHAAWHKGAQTQALNRARCAACDKAEQAQEARALAEQALIEAQVEAMDPQEQSDFYQAIAESRVGC
jgi:hypothetical protein